MGSRARVETGRAESIVAVEEVHGQEEEGSGCANQDDSDDRMVPRGCSRGTKGSCSPPSPPGQALRAPSPPLLPPHPAAEPPDRLPAGAAPPSCISILALAAESFGDRNIDLAGKGTRGVG